MVLHKHTQIHQKIKIITKMVHIRFTSLVLGLIFVTHALREFYAHAHQGWEMKGNGFEVTSREDLMSTNYHKKLPNIIGMDSNYLRKLGFGGRKMVGHNLPSKKEVKKDELDEEAAELNKTTISGKDSKNEEKTAILGSSSTPRSKKDHLEDTKSKPTKAMSLDDHDSPPNGETQRQRLLDEADEELVTLMHRDYNQPNRARRKPPINNGVPKH